MLVLSQNHGWPEGQLSLIVPRLEDHQGSDSCVKGWRKTNGGEQVEQLASNS